MHYLCCTLGENRFAIPSNNIVRIFPLLALTEAIQAPSYIAGYFCYQDKFIITIDVKQLLLGGVTNKLMSSRLVMVDFLAKNNRSYQAALLLENAVETIKIIEQEWQENPLLPQKGHIGGKIANVNDSSIQQIILSELLTDEVLELIHDLN